MTLRMTGRSTRRVISAVSQALGKPGIPVTIMDHNDLHNSHLRVAVQVSEVLSLLGVKHTIKGTVITVKPIIKGGRNVRNQPVPFQASQDS